MLLLGSTVHGRGRVGGRRRLARRCARRFARGEQLRERHIVVSIFIGEAPREVVAPEKVPELGLAVLPTLV